LDVDVPQREGAVKQPALDLVSEVDQPARGGFYLVIDDVVVDVVDVGLVKADEAIKVGGIGDGAGPGRGCCSSSAITDCP